MKKAELKTRSGSKPNPVGRPKTGNVAVTYNVRPATKANITKRAKLAGLLPGKLLDNMFAD